MFHFALSKIKIIPEAAIAIPFMKTSAAGKAPGGKMNISGKIFAMIPFVHGGRGGGGHGRCVARAGTDWLTLPFAQNQSSLMPYNFRPGDSGDCHLPPALPGRLSPSADPAGPQPPRTVLSPRRRPFAY
ncbi:MAG: hypothetical protein RR376_11720 [Janthinobacterium sp.]